MQEIIHSSQVVVPSEHVRQTFPHLHIAFPEPSHSSAVKDGVEYPARSMEAIIQDHLCLPNHAMVLLLPEVEETVLLYRRENDLMLLRAREGLNGNENTEEIEIPSLKPYVTTSFTNDTFSLSVAAGLNEESYYDLVVTANPDGGSEFKMLLGKIVWRNDISYKHNKGIEMHSVAEKGTDEYKRALQGIAQTEEQLKKGQLNSRGIYRTYWYETKGYLAYKTIQSSDTHITRERNGEVRDSFILLERDNKWRIRLK